MPWRSVMARFTFLQVGHSMGVVLGMCGAGPCVAGLKCARCSGSARGAGWLSWTHLRRGAAKVLLKADGRLAAAPEPEARIDGDSARELLPFEPRSSMASCIHRKSRWRRAPACHESRWRARVGWAKAVPSDFAVHLQTGRRLAGWEIGRAHV